MEFVTACMSTGERIICEVPDRSDGFVASLGQTMR
jgi:hypothetical protein